MNIKVGAFLGGLVFGIGLALSGMTQPAKIVGFFDFGNWDPSLAFVMLGATAVYTPFYRWATRTWQKPVWAPRFLLPTRRDIDWKLLTGSAMFGVGWGLGGYCPGPAFTSLGAGSKQALVFTAAMVVGAGAYQLYTKARDTPASTRSGAPATIDG